MRQKGQFKLAVSPRCQRNWSFVGSGLDCSFCELLLDRIQIVHSKTGRRHDISVLPMRRLAPLFLPFIDFEIKIEVCTVLHTRHHGTS